MIKHQDPLVEDVGLQIAAQLAAIAKFFKPDARLTLVVRHPDHPNGELNIVVTEDSLDDVIVAIRQRQKGFTL